MQGQKGKDVPCDPSVFTAAMERHQTRRDLGNHTLCWEYTTTEREILWIFINQVAQGNPQPLSWGCSAKQWKGSDPCVHGGIIAVGSFLFLVIKDPLEGELEGPQGAGSLEPSCQEVDEGFNAALDAVEQEKNFGRHNDVAKLLQEIAEAEK
ncbi:hypothetical protein HGM15179_019646 [Zosterops borbonicus]|uniref:Uncharacterized protein n=1 Tax=Zosterops borbonicus TaxID=364589 RepID=A0A8K1FUX5_9PASS|nr:hypothetical protein HGM15179_019646 [Zosterops borbonicus]